MNIQRFQAPTSREALAKARRALGEDALVLSSRSTAGGIEVLAVPDTEVRAAAPAAQEPAAPVAPATARAAARSSEPARRAVERDTEQLAMSTLSFQEYVRERMTRKREQQAAAAAPERAEAAATPRRPEPAPVLPAAPRAEVPRQEEPARVDHGAGTRQIFERLQAMESLIDQRLSTMAWLGQTRQDPIASQLLMLLLRAGYSSALARRLVEGLAGATEAAQAMRRLREALAVDLLTDAGEPELIDEGGVLALVGPSGAGKTTVTAKLAARCVARHGTGSVGLISVDHQRPGAHEQLRASARALGLVAHVAADAAALRELLGLFSGKKLVLVDTAGLGHAGPVERIDPGALPGVRNLLVLAASSHGDALEAAVAAHPRRVLAGAVLTKLDEAGKLGPALDVAMRHRLLLRGVCNGPRIPEDFSRPRADELVQQSLRSRTASPWSPAPDDLAFHFNAPRSEAAAY